MSVFGNPVSRSSNFSCSSFLDSCAHSLPLKIASCIPIVGLATSFFAVTYAINSEQQIYKALNESRANSPIGALLKTPERIEWLEVARDHCLASVIRHVATIGLAALGIATGGAFHVGINIGLGIVSVCVSTYLNTQIQKTSTLVDDMKTELKFTRFSGY